jgi:signal transduction histidine kinase
VTATSRRIFLYWFVLLVAALGVGGGAWMLLRREEARLAARASTTEAARRAAVEARARLVAENVELLVGDVEAGLLDTLVEAQAGGIDGFLDDWERSNPLVRSTFRCTDNGSLLRPDSSVTGDDARGFRRRFAAKLKGNPPWQLQNQKDEMRRAAPETAAQSPILADSSSFEARRQITSNVMKAQSARKETQALAKSKSSYAPSVAKKDRAFSEGEFERSDKNAGAAAVPPQSDRRGWLPWLSEGRLHLLGWVQPGGMGEVRGVEVEMATLVSRLGGAMPAELAVDEGYTLRDDKGRVLHQSGQIPKDGIAPAARIPLSTTLLPGWEVVAYQALAPTKSDGGGFMLIGLLLTGILVMAIVTGGSLLLWQARRSEADAVQKTSFVANVSHEFKTPLTTIRLYSELLEEGRVPDGEKRRVYLQTIGRETQRLARLVNNVLDFSRLEQGRKKYQCTQTDLVAVVAQLLDAHNPRIAEAGLVLLRELPVELVSVNTDRDAVEQILINLLDNACKYAASGGEVTVFLGRRASGSVELRVCDRGSGVPPAHRERIFEKFHRVDDTLTAEKGGAGLGLSIARQLARGLGGELSYVARTGGGAEFVLYLP